MESFVLGWAREEVVPKDNQFGEEPRSGTEHFFVQAMNKISSALGDNRSAVVLTAVDFSKVFNRIEHGACLNTFAAKASSLDILQILARFLCGCTMSVKVQKEVLVRFDNSQIRDTIHSYAPNLATAEGKAGLRLDIPVF